MYWKYKSRPFDPPSLLWIVTKGRSLERPFVAIHSKDCSSLDPNAQEDATGF
jgi:hypothetical protein